MTIFLKNGLKYSFFKKRPGLSLILRLIFVKFENRGHPRSKLRGHVNISIKTRLLTKKAVFSMFIVFLVFGTSLTPLYAGLFSLFSSIFTEKEEMVSYKSNYNSGALSAVYNSDPNPSKGGGGVKIVDNSALASDSGPRTSEGDTKSIATPDQISIYVVREGDSLSQIANMFDVTTETILWANDIGRGGVIKPGQTLVILPISGVRHTVKKGDTLATIAKQYSGEAKEIAEFNDLQENSLLVVGDELIIPHGKKATPSPKQNPTRVVNQGPSYSGYYIAPLQAYKKSQGIHGYNGVDLAAPSGTPILASAAGEVLISRTGWNGGYGNYVVISHSNGTQTVYAHNSQNIVYAGQQVVQGQVIGYVGSTGRSTGSHVHFEVRGAKNPF